MMTPARHDVGGLAVGVSILLVICAASLSAGCALSGQPRPDLPASTVGGQSAGLIPGSWNQVAGLRPGSQIVVTLKGGDRFEGAFRALEPSDLDLTDSGGRDFRVARSDIGQIVARGERDDLTNGVLIGAGIGLGTALAILVGLASGDGYLLPSAKWGAPVFLSAVCGLVGVLIDRAHTDDQVVYVTP